MSSVGRIFIVINLLLSGCFVYFSGVYLREATDWKTKFDTEAKSHVATKDADAATAKRLSDDLAQAQRQLDASQTNAGNLETQLKREREINEANDKRFAAMASDVAALQANTATQAVAIDRATKDSEEARKVAIEANRQRDDAVRAKEVAVADSRDKSDQIAALEATIAKKDEAKAVADATIREQGVKLEWFQQKFPGALVNALPKLAGTVQRVDSDGKLLTVLVTDDPSEVGVKAGYSFAVFNGATYKGEATVTDVDGKFAFCRMTRSTGKPVVVGDSASTQTN